MWVLINLLAVYLYNSIIYLILQAVTTPTQLGFDDRSVQVKSSDPELMKRLFLGQFQY